MTGQRAHARSMTCQGIVAGTHLEDWCGQDSGKVLLHVGGQRGAPADDEAHAPAKGGLEGAEDVLVQQRRRLRPEAERLLP